MLPQDWRQLVVAWKQLEAAGRGRAEEEGGSYAPGSAGGEGSRQKSPTVYPVGSLKHQHFWKIEKGTPTDFAQNSKPVNNGVLVVVLPVLFGQNNCFDWHWLWNWWNCETSEALKILCFNIFKWMSKTIDFQQNFNPSHIGLNSFFFDSESIKANKKGVLLFLQVTCIIVGLP